MEKNFFDKKPVIGMVHLLPLPGSVGFKGSLSQIEDTAFADMNALTQGGADAFIIENFGDVPYDTEMGPEALAVMTAIAAKLSREAKLPFGINVQFNNTDWEWAMAYATGAAFIRVEALVENRIGGHGVTYAAGPKLMKKKAAYPAGTMIFADIHTKHTFPLGAEIPTDLCVHEAVEAGADALIVTGLLTGCNPSIEDVKAVKAVAPHTPVILGSGIKESNIKEYFQVADGAIIGSSIKVDGNVNNPVDIDRVRSLMAALRG